MFNENSISTFLSKFDSEKHARMIQVFSKGFNLQLERCEKALKAQNASDLKEVAHDLKSIAGTIEAKEIEQLSEEIEELIIRGEDNKALHLAPDLIPKLKNAITLLEKKSLQY